MKAGGTASEETKGRDRSMLPKLKIFQNICKNRRQQTEAHPEETQQQQHEEEEEELLEEASRKLISREEKLFGLGSPIEEQEHQLQSDLEALLIQVWMVVNNTFSATSSSSDRDLKALQSAVAAILQQEAQDRRWANCPDSHVPDWRPHKCLSTHTTMLHNIVQSRLSADDSDTGSSQSLSSPLKREVCRLGKRVKEDLLMVVRKVKDCYPPEIDVINLYAGLYQQNFSARLAELSAPGLEAEDCRYLLFWVNHYYPNEILKHEELEGKIKAACLGSLLPTEQVNLLEEQYVTHKEETMESWLSRALSKEQESWLSGAEPEHVTDYCFTPLAVIQVVDSFLTEFSCVVRDQNKAQRITACLESFLCRYKQAVEEFVKGNHINVQSVMKANLVCVEQFSDYLTGKAGSLMEQQRISCLETLSAQRDYGYRYFTQPIHKQLKVCFSQLWTSVWLKKSVPVIYSVLDCVDQQLHHFKDLKPSCREVLLSLLHEDVVLQYIKRTMKMKIKSREQQVNGAGQMIEDADQIREFFTKEGCAESSYLNVALCSIAEILHLQHPGSVHLEMVSLSRAFPDLSDVHVSVLLSLRSDMSSADIRSIRQSVREHRLLDTSTNHSPPFFSKVKVKWIKINQMVLKAF
ncbi:tumor necrosis factor alpha-induced protein 2-like isoform X2 [Genypterus blacodes]|uniref:tumor necrosis factor alpha-induced protein 2-like isoform X2 n=1 Tax=Genypterus blacodes TaxID=154954 RepID=UPI003F758C96